MHYRGGSGRRSTSRSIPTSTSSGTTSRASMPRRSRRSRKLGCTYLQLDDTSLAYLNDPAQRAYVTQHRRRRRHAASDQHPADQRGARRASPPGMTICTHMCRGNFRSSWVASGGYDHVAEALFGELEGRRLLPRIRRRALRRLRAAALRAQGQEAVVLGLVTSKRGALENEGRAETPHRRGGEIRAARSALPQSAMRLLVDRSTATRSTANSRTPSCASSSRPPARSGAERLSACALNRFLQNFEHYRSGSSQTLDLQP